MYGVHTAARRTDARQRTDERSVVHLLHRILGGEPCPQPNGSGHRGHRGFQFVEFSLFHLGLADLGIFIFLKSFFTFFVFFGFYSFLFTVLITLRARLNGAVYCYRSCL